MLIALLSLFSLLGLFGGGVVGCESLLGPRGTPTISQPLPEPILGYALNVHHVDELDRYLAAVDEIADLGANWLTVVTPMYQQRSDSVHIEQRPGLTPTDEQLIAILRRGREAGLRTALQPIVLIARPEADEWRGTIEPRDWDRWWRSYDRLLDRFLALSRDGPVDALIIGSELNTTESQRERWLERIARVRGAFDGLLIYSANWDRYRHVTFWDAVDAIGVSAYFELETRGRPESDEGLVRRWRREADRLEAFAARKDRPLVLTEVGYPSLPWALAEPWNYVRDDTVDRPDHDAPARGWRAFFAVWAGRIRQEGNPASGFIGYHWDPYYEGWINDYGYGLRGKPGYDIVREGFAESRRP